MPFSYEFLKELREREVQDVLPYFPKGAALLEIGGGAGYQAKAFADSGLQVTSIDIPQSNYVQERIFPVIDYDGVHIPAPDASFDVVYSSNVLEHVKDLPSLHAEIRRVLKPGGYCVHIVPSPVWRFWTSVTSVLTMLAVVGRMSLSCLPRGVSRYELRRMGQAAYQVFQRAIDTFRPVPHGERGNPVSELWYFSRWWWQENFRANGLQIDKVVPMGLFYTGYMLLGPYMSFGVRSMLASFLGSATTLFVVRYK